MKRSPWLPLFGATLLAGIGLPVQVLQAQDYSRLPVLAREAPVVAGREVPAVPVGDPIVNVLPSQLKNLPDVNGSLKVVHRRSQLIVAKGNVVRTAIADPSVVEVVQYSPNEIAFIGQSLGTTTVTMWFDDGSEPLIYLVETVRDPSLEERKKIDYGKLEKKLALLFPNSKVYLIPLSYKIIVKGQARDSEEASRILSLIAGEVINQVGSLAGPQPAATPGVDPVGLINPNNLASNYIVNMLEVPGEFQVMLRVRIAELNRSMLRKMGVNIAVLINDGQHFFSSVLQGAVSAGGIAAATANAPITGIFSSGDVAVLINALASNGTATILAEPVLTVLSGHPASFLSGGEFAVPTIVGVQGVGAQQTTFRGFGTSLLVTPTVLDKDHIRLQIMPEYSQVTGGNTNGIPNLGVRRAQTTVQLREGQTIAIAGLMSRRTTSEVGRVPYLAEIPIVGPLIFAAKQDNQDENELLILVTPELVRPMEADEVPPVPGHEVTRPDDKQFYCLAMTEGPPYQKVNQLPPYGWGGGRPEEVGYTNYNPNPAQQGYAPGPGGQFMGGGYGGPVPFGPQAGGRYNQGAPGARGPMPGQLPPQNSMPANAAPPGRGVPTPVNPSASRWNPFTRNSSGAIPAGGIRQGGQTYPAGGYPSQYAPSQYAPSGTPGGHTIPRGTPSRYSP